MKKVFFISLAILVVSGSWFYFISDHEMQSVLAQKDEAEAAKKREMNTTKIFHRKKLIEHILKLGKSWIVS